MTANAIDRYLRDKATTGRTDLIRVGGASYFVDLGLCVLSLLRLETAHFADEDGEFKKRGVLQKKYSLRVLQATDDLLELEVLEGVRACVYALRPGSALIPTPSRATHSRASVSTAQSPSSTTSSCTLRQSGSTPRSRGDAI